MGPVRKDLFVDVVIVGGGTAGCLAAVTIKERAPTAKVMIVEKAEIERSGCLAAGMNAINAYLNPGETPESFAKYVRYDAMGLIREDLVLSAAQRLNKVVKKVEEMGLPIQKKTDGTYIPRGRWNIKINGENLKPLLAQAVKDHDVQVINRVVATNYLINREGRAAGVMGFGVRDECFYVIKAKAVICATGGAAGIYHPHNPVDGHHKTWYSPFNTGAGYAMGIRASAEMTTFEMRFIALRTKDIICPTGTLALGFKAPQVNSYSVRYMTRDFSHLGGEGAPTCLRLYGYLKETKEGRGPCYMDTRHLSPERVRELKESYLDMYPGIVLYWAANRINPGQEQVEISGTEPYIMGGHCQAGYWIDRKRETTVKGLYACGDVAGGYPFKFVSGCWAEGTIAGESAVEYIEEALGGFNSSLPREENGEAQISKEKERVFRPQVRYRQEKSGIRPWEMEERIQKIMDEYAGGIGSFYEINEHRLVRAGDELRRLQEQVRYLVAGDSHELMQAHEVIDRLIVAEVLVEHLRYRKETRWPGFQSRTDYPERDDLHWLKFVNSKLKANGEIEMIERPYKQEIPGERYIPR